MTIVIEESTDCDRLSAVARATFLETFADMIAFSDIKTRAESEDSPDAFRRQLDDGARAWLAVVESTQSPVGFAMTTLPDLPEVEIRSSDLELKRIYLLHRFHGQGVGKRLHDSVEAGAAAAGASRLLLGVKSDNPTVGWYRRQGYEKLGERYFQVGDSRFHDLILGKKLSA